MRFSKTLAVACALALSGTAMAQDLLVRNAKVHTATSRGTLEHADVLVRNGRIAAVGTNLQAGNATVVEANGRALTPALFGGITDIGLEEVSGESATVDSQQSLGEEKDPAVRPEFDVTLAYNPESVLLPVARVEGIGWTMLAAGSTTGGSIVGGQGGVVRLDGSLDPLGPKALFLSLGSSAANLTGNSRAAQWMILDQLVAEARGRMSADSKFAMLTPMGRAAFAKFLDRRGLIVVNVNRAVDIVQLLRWSKRNNVRVAVTGGAEAWKVADQLAAAKVPVFVDTLADLPADFDQTRCDAGERRALAQSGRRSRDPERGFASRAQGAADGGQRGGQRLAVGRRPGGADARAGASLRRGRRHRHDRGRASARTWCCGAAIRSTSPPWPKPYGSTVARSQCGRARPSCATVTCIRPTACPARILPAPTEEPGRFRTCIT